MPLAKLRELEAVFGEPIDLTQARSPNGALLPFFGGGFPY